MSLESFILSQKQPEQAALAQISHKSALPAIKSVREKKDCFSDKAKEIIGEQSLKHVAKDSLLLLFHEFLCTLKLLLIQEKN